jgi:hypothetical protein
LCSFLSLRFSRSGRLAATVRSLLEGFCLCFQCHLECCCYRDSSDWVVSLLTLHPAVLFWSKQRACPRGQVCLFLWLPPLEFATSSCRSARVLCRSSLPHQQRQARQSDWFGCRSSCFARFVLSSPGVHFGAETSLPPAVTRSACFLHQ